MTFKKLLERSGKTRSDIVAEVGCSQPYLSMLEADLRSVGPKYLVPMAKALGVSPAELRPDLAAIYAGGASQSVNSNETLQAQSIENNSEVQS